MDVSKDPLFPFRYGLSYTQFGYSNLRLDKNNEANRQIAGKSASCHYWEIRWRRDSAIVHDIFASVTQNVKKLKAFQKVFFKAGEAKDVIFTLSVEDLKFYHSDLICIYELGDFQVFAGCNSRGVQEGAFVLKK